MPYFSRVTGLETASKLGHLSIVADPLVKELLASFETTTPEPVAPPEAAGRVSQLKLGWKSGIGFVVALDGSISDVPNTLARHKTLSYLKVASLCLSLSELEKAQRPIVDPDFVRDVLTKNADTFSTVLPLSNVRLKGKSQFETIRRVVHTTLRTVEAGALYDTLNFLVSQTWAPTQSYEPQFACPYCRQTLSIPRNAIEFPCPGCGRGLYLSDYLSLAPGVNEESNDDAAAVGLLHALEHLAVIRYLRALADRGPEYTSQVLIVKDGPLMMVSQFARLVEPIKLYLEHLKNRGLTFYLAGVEKTGAFVNHIDEIKGWLNNPGQVFIPSNDYILKRIKHAGGPDTQYGQRVLYGAKAFLCLDGRGVVVLTVPTGYYMLDPTVDDLIGFREIANVLVQLQSRQFENALLPIVAANRIASMSIYPSNNILERFMHAMLAATESASGFRVP